MVSLAQPRVLPSLAAISPPPPAGAGWIPCPTASWVLFAGRRSAMLSCARAGVVPFPLPCPPAQLSLLSVQPASPPVPPAAMAQPAALLTSSFLFAATRISGLVDARCWEASSLLQALWSLSPPLVFPPPVPPAGLGWGFPPLASWPPFGAKRTSSISGAPVWLSSSLHPVGGLAVGGLVDETSTQLVAAVVAAVSAVQVQVQVLFLELAALTVGPSCGSWPMPRRMVLLAPMAVGQSERCSPMPVGRLLRPPGAPTSSTGRSPRMGRIHLSPPLLG